MPSPRQPPPQIDRAKLRARLRLMGTEYIYYMLDDAIDLLPDAKLAELAGQYIRLEELRPDPAQAAERRSLLDDVRAFDKASRTGSFYESFLVDSGNFMSKSSGTAAFIAECRRLLERCIKEERGGDPSETRHAFEIIFNLHRYIDEGHDVVFFADEAGAWQIGVDWRRVFPAWFACLSLTTDPDEFARLALAAIGDFGGHSPERHLAAAREVATAAQRDALDRLQARALAVGPLVGRRE